MGYLENYFSKGIYSFLKFVLGIWILRENWKDSVVLKSN